MSFLVHTFICTCNAFFSRKYELHFYNVVIIIVKIERYIKYWGKGSFSEEKKINITCINLFNCYCYWLYSIFIKYIFLYITEK